MKVLVTGARGQLGEDLCPRLEAAGHEVACFDLPELDITAPERVMEAVQAERPAVLVNCAAYTAVDQAESEEREAFAVNRDGARHLAEAARAIDAALVQVSTDFVFDGASTQPYTEEDEPRPLNVYGASKLAGEEQVRLLPAHFIVRTSWLYGVGGAGNFVKTMLRLAGEREQLRVVDDQLGCPTWTADLAAALAVIVDAVDREAAPPYGTFHYSNEGVASWRQLAAAAVEGARRAGAAVRCTSVDPIKTVDYPAAAQRPAYSVLDKSRIKQVFGLEIPQWQDSLARMLTELLAREDR